MNILHVIDTTGPGGAETIYTHLACKLNNNGYNSTAVIRGRGWVYDNLVKCGIEPIIVESKGKFNYRYIAAIVKIVREKKIDLIHSHLLGANVYMSIVGLLLNVPVVSTFHGPVDVGDQEKFKWLKYFLINKGSSFVVCVSDSLRKDILKRTTIIPDKIKVIFNGINFNGLTDVSVNQLHNKYFTIGCLGNIRKPKAYDVLLQVAAKLKKNGYSFRFLIAGQPDKGGLYESLLDEAVRLDITEMVSFIGFVDNVADFLSEVDMFLSTSSSEGFPLSAMQAMVMKKPLVATSCTGYIELIEDKNIGTLVEVGDVDALASAIIDVHDRPEYYQQIAKNAKDYVLEKFDVNSMTEQYLKLYSDAIKK